MHDGTNMNVQIWALSIVAIALLRCIIKRKWCSLEKEASQDNWKLWKYVHLYIYVNNAKEPPHCNVVNQTWHSFCSIVGVNTTLQPPASKLAIRRGKGWKSLLWLENTKYHNHIAVKVSRDNSLPMSRVKICWDWLVL